jgi:hypothetical protein
LNTTVGNLLAERIELGRALCRTIAADDTTAEAAARRCISDCLARLDPALRDAHVDAEFIQAMNALFTVHHTRYDGADGPVVAKREDELLYRLDLLAAR